MGVEPYLLTSSITAILAQRLVRKICPHCKIVHEVSEYERELLKAYFRNGERTLYKGQGCDYCLNTGYTGRIGIFELLMLTSRIRQMVQEKAPSEEIKAQAIRDGMATLREDGLRKAFEGITTLSEVIRVTIE